MRLKLVLFSMVVVITIIGLRATTSPAFTIRDSTAFVSTIDQIEGDVDPVSLADWTADLGDFAGQLTINGDGTLTVVTNTDAYDRWSNFGEITNAGWTVEIRACVDVASVGADPGVFDILSRDGATNSPWIFLQGDGIGERSGSTSLLHAVDLTDDFHVIRVAAESTAGDINLWVDGTLVATDWGNDGNFPSAVFLGRNGANTVDGGTTTIDYVRFDTSGAYAPVPEPSSFALVGIALIGMLGIAHRRK